LAPTNTTFFFFFLNGSNYNYCYCFLLFAMHDHNNNDGDEEETKSGPPPWCVTSKNPLVVPSFGNDGGGGCGYYCPLFCYC
jgi:hypothetical protein